MKKLSALLALFASSLTAFAGSPILWGPNNTATNLQSQVMHNNGALAASNGPKNYITYGNFENGATTGWSLGTVGALTNGLPTGTPTFGSGASVNLSLGTTTGVLAGTSLTYISSAATTQGDMVASQAYSINPEDQAKVMQVRFNFTATSGSANMNFSGTSSNSYAWAAWDVTNSVWLSSVANFCMVQSTGQGVCTGTFQTGASTASLRFVVYNANATAGAATLALDDFSVGPQITSMGPPVTDWQSYTPSFNAAWGTTSAVVGKYRRVGDSLEIQITVSMGTGTASSGTISIPSGLVIDTSKLAFSGVPSAAVGFYGSDSTAPSGGTILANSGDNTHLYIGGGFSGAGASGSDRFISMNSFQATSAFVIKAFNIPVTGWSSNTNQSSDSDTRVTNLMAYGPSNSATANNIIVFPNVFKDTHGAYNASTGQYSCPITGWYQVQAGSDGSITVGNALYVSVAGNTTAGPNRPWINFANASNGPVVGSATVYCTAGQTIDVRPTSAYGAGSVASDTLQITRVSGPAVMQAADSVNFRYFASSTSLSGSLATINWTTKDYDTTNGMASGTWTSSISGKFHCNAQIKVAATFALNNTVVIELQKNGTVVSRNTVFAAAAVTDLNAAISDDVSILGGDTLRIQVSSSGTSPSVAASNFENFFSCNRSGN